MHDQLTNAQPERTHADKMSDVDRRYWMTLQARDRVAENRKNRTARGNVVSLEEVGTVATKLAKAMGGKAAQRIIKHERRLGRETPNALKVFAIFRSPTTKEVIREAELCRGRDYVVVNIPKQGPTLMLDDGVTEFRAEHDKTFPETLQA